MAYSLSTSPAVLRGPQPLSEAPGVARSGRLIHLEPVLRVMHECESALAYMKRYSPNTDAIPALMEVASQLATAVSQSKSVRVDSTIDDVATRIGRPRSTVTDWANAYGCAEANETAWAEKRGGTWMIDNARFEEWFRANKEKLNSRRRVQGQRKREVSARAA